MAAKRSWICKTHMMGGIWKKGRQGHELNKAEKLDGNIDIYTYIDICAYIFYLNTMYLIPNS